MKKVFIAAIILETILLLYFSLLPFQPLIGDKSSGRTGDVEHFLAYLVYAILWTQVLNFRDRKMVLLGAIGLAVVVGGLIEVIQTVIPYRTADLLDVGVNTLGALVGALIIRLKR